MNKENTKALILIIMTIMVSDPHNTTRRNKWKKRAKFSVSHLKYESFVSGINKEFSQPRYARNKISRSKEARKLTEILEQALFLLPWAGFRETSASASSGPDIAEPNTSLHWKRSLWIQKMADNLHSWWPRRKHIQWGVNIGEKDFVSVKKASSSSRDQSRVFCFCFRFFK